MDTMVNRKARRILPKKVRPPRSMNRAAPVRLAPTGTKPLTRATGDGKLHFNHAMIYVRDVERAVRFYRDLLGFKLIEDSTGS